ncbi:hypothetical protein C8R46DRAFT_1294519 [Mycena filopes]|nr:hypothetical protein C8R46DRAFT_1294519 [Mycena filopes]
MPRTSKTDTQGDLLHLAETLLVTSIALEDDDDADLLGYEEDEAEFLEDDITDILDLAALNWMEIVHRMTGDASDITLTSIDAPGSSSPPCAALPSTRIESHGPPRRRYPYEHERAGAVFSSMCGATLCEYRDSRAASSDITPTSINAPGPSSPPCAALPSTRIESHGPPRRRYPYEHKRAGAVFSFVCGATLYEFRNSAA